MKSQGSKDLISLAFLYSSWGVVDRMSQGEVQQVTLRSRNRDQICNRALANEWRQAPLVSRVEKRKLTL